MGKIRAKTIGDEELEQKEREEAEKRRLAKIEAAKAEGQAKKDSKTKNQESNDAGVVRDEGPQNVPAVSETNDAHLEAGERQDPKAKKTTKPSSGRSENYKKAASLVEKSKTYSLSQAIELLEKTHLAKFDETVELHINTLSSLSGSMNLPHGTGKQTRVAILAPGRDAKAADELLKKIESGKIEFDVLIATPDAMPKLAKVARVLGPKGLMPNPKAGTVTPNPDEAAKKYAGGHMTFKTEAKASVLHLSVGKLSFGKDKLEENIKTALKAVESKNMKKVVLKSTMSPAVRLSVK